MSMMRMENRSGYTIVGPMSEAVHLPVRLSKSQSVRREPKISGNNLRSLYQNPASPANHRVSLSSTENAALGPATPVLPPTPPNVEDEAQDHSEEPSSASDAAKIRSILATPVHQISPPTPDNTPPRQQPRMRPFLGTQPSLASSHAESFKTAREEVPSDKESVSSMPMSRPRNNHSSPGLPPLLTNSTHKPSPLAYAQAPSVNYNSKDSSPVIPSSATIPSLAYAQSLDHGYSAPVYGLGEGQYNTHTSEITKESPRSLEHQRVPEEQYRPASSHTNNIPRGRSLRDRLEESRQIPHSPSVDKFASIIGWNNGVQNSTNESKRWSGVSNTSTVEAILIEKPRTQKQRNTLRHVSKNESLRSVSSPLPKSNRTSLQSTSEFSHRLVHKTARLGNRHRLSFDSEMSRPVSVGSVAAPKYEVIKVAVIPERSSSLQRSSTSSRRRSHSNVGAPTSFRMPRTSDTQQRRRASLETTERGRSRHYPPQVPPRRSSLSAPTSRNTSRTTSRANSLTSDNLHCERKRAEKDLRSTLDRMETDRLVSSLKSASVENAVPIPPAVESTPTTKGHDLPTDTQLRLADITPGTKEWADLRPPSVLHTPFSQPSFMSASPEISEARLISVSVHNNHSVHIIEPLLITESHAVREVRRYHAPNELSAPSNIDSPLRNPRRPPTPPQFEVIPPTPHDEGQVMFGEKSSPNEEEPVQRPGIQSRDDSFAKTLLRTVSLKNARNKKADQDLDSSLHPFWRPRAFWDDIDPASPEKKKKKTTENNERGLVHNSLGIPQERVVVTGPLGLIRRLSERRRHRKTVVKQSSHNSLHRLRVAKRLYRVPGLGVQLPLMSPREIQEKMHMARRRREEEKREKRREELRKKIGASVVATGDSRFPTAMADNDIAVAR